MTLDLQRLLEASKAIQHRIVLDAEVLLEIRASDWFISVDYFGGKTIETLVGFGITGAGRLTYPLKDRPNFAKEASLIEQLIADHFAPVLKGKLIALPHEGRDKTNMRDPNFLFDNDKLNEFKEALVSFLDLSHDLDLTVRKDVLEFQQRVIDGDKDELIERYLSKGFMQGLI